jgi:hypothetical protein
MAAVKANDILSYRGDPNDVVATEGGPWGVLNTPQTSVASRDLAIFAVQRGKQLYEQRIADRDKVYQKIDDEELVPKDILDVDRARIDQKLNNIQNVFLKYKGDIMNNPDRYREYLRAINDAKGDIKQAQKRYIGVTADLQQKTKAGNPVEAGNYDKHISNYLSKDFYSTYNPYVPITTFDMDKVLVKPTYTPNGSQPKFYRDKNGFWKESEEVIDKQKLFDQTNANWQNKEYRHYFTNQEESGLLDQFHYLSPQEMLMKLHAWNSGIEKHNSDLGIKNPNDPNYIPPIQVAQRPQGGFEVVGNPAEVAAKIVLAENPAKKVVKEWDKERAGYNIDERQLSIQDRHNRAMEGLEGQKVQWEKQKWEASVGGTKEMKNSASVFAESIFGQLKGIADQDGIITPDKARQMTSEQLKYLGSYQEVDGKKTWVPLFKKVSDDGKTLEDIDIDKNGLGLQIDKTGQVKVFKFNKDNDGTFEKTPSGRYLGKWQKDMSTTVSNIATLRLHDENQNAAGQEIKNYNAIDNGVGGTNTSTDGGGYKFKGSYSIGGKNYSMDELRGMGYTNEQIKAAIDAGKLK